MERVRVDEKGRIVIPKRLRRRLGIEAGDILEIGVEDGRIVLSKAMDPWNTISEVLGKYGIVYGRDLRLEAERQLRNEAGLDEEDIGGD